MPSARARQASNFISRELLANDERHAARALPFLRTFPLLRGMGQMHLGRKAVSDGHGGLKSVGDCTHWCLPGALDAALLPALQEFIEGLVVASPVLAGADESGPITVSKSMR